MRRKVCIIFTHLLLWWHFLIHLTVLEFHGWKDPNYVSHVLQCQKNNRRDTGLQSAVVSSECPEDLAVHFCFFFFCQTSTADSEPPQCLKDEFTISIQGRMLQWLFWPKTWHQKHSACFSFLLLQYNYSIFNYIHQYLMLFSGHIFLSKSDTACVLVLFLRLT